MRVVRIQGLSSPVMETVGGLLLACLAFYGALRIKAGTMTGGGFLIFLLAIYQLYDPLRILTRSYADLQMSSVALERIFEPAGFQAHRSWLLPTRSPCRIAPDVIALEGVRLQLREGRGPARAST